MTTTGTFKNYPRVRCAMLGEFTLCGNAFDVGEWLVGADPVAPAAGDWVEDEVTRAITCKECQEHIRQVRSFRLSTVTRSFDD